MKTEQFSNALNNINDTYVEEAANYQAKASTDAIIFETKKERKKAPKGLRIWRGIAIAACAILVAGIGLVAIAANLSMGGASKDAAYEYMNEVAPGAGAYVDAESEGSYFGAVAMDEGLTDYNNEKSEDMAGIPEAIANNKIIYTAYISMETKEFEKVASDLELLVNSMGGYFEWAEVNSNSSDYRYGSYTIRIPAERLKEFLDQAGSLCTVKNSNKSAEDVSEYYYDTESRLETAKTKLKRLQELLAQAATMEDIIELEREISDTEQLIDSYTGTLKQYDSLVDYAKVNIDLREVYRDSSVNQPLTFGQRISNSFKDGLKGFGWFLENLLVWLASSWIWLLIIAAIVVVVVLIIKKKINKKKNNKNIQQ
ncbi:MAG: DUF4349 domain-containing protein [Lachnospiraceae bacterium]|nr:DUF4349 domain-containing protein [Lachnospiraceae bacterium]